VGGERLDLTVGSAGQLATAADALAPLALERPRLDEQTRRLTLPVTGGAATLAEALRRLAASPVDVLDIGLRRPDLDDVFLTLTGHAAEQPAAGTDQPTGDDELADAQIAGALR
jgi:ABC-2 type transport system ATP-binding protein